MDDRNAETPIDRDLRSAVDAAYDEALTLTEEVRDYITAGQPKGEDGADGGRGAAAVALTSQLVARLLEIVSWLAAQKALHAGELSADEAAANAAQLSTWNNDVAGHDAGAQALAPALRRLNDRGRALHQRVRGLAA